MRPINKTGWRRLMIADADAYGAARQMVLVTTGFYCAYCESPLGVDMPVEHKTPKGGAVRGDNTCFPDDATRYFNFLMACSACNSAKGAHPNKAEGASWLSQVFAAPPTDYVSVLYGALCSMVWPDTLDAAMSDARPVPAALQPYFTGRDETYRLFKYVRTPKTQAQLNASGDLRLPPAAANAPWTTVPQDRVWVLPDEAYINAQPNPIVLMVRVKTTLSRLNLNLCNPTDLKASDRRVLNRTAAWDTATAALAEVARVVAAGLLNPAGIQAAPVFSMILLLREVARATGYWSTWMAVFQSVLQGVGAPWNGVPAADRASLVRALLVQHAAGENIAPIFNFQQAPPPVFTGTDLTRVVL